MKNVSLFVSLFWFMAAAQAENCPNFSGNWRNDLFKESMTVTQVACDEITAKKGDKSLIYLTDGKIHDMPTGYGFTKCSFQDQTFVTEHWTSELGTEIFAPTQIWDLYNDASGSYLRIRYVDPEKGDMGVRIFKKDP